MQTYHLLVKTCCSNLNKGSCNHCWTALMQYAVYENAPSLFFLRRSRLLLKKFMFNVPPDETIKAKPRAGCIVKFTHDLPKHAINGVCMLAGGHPPPRTLFEVLVLPAHTVSVGVIYVWKLFDRLMIPDFVGRCNKRRNKRKGISKTGLGNWPHSGVRRWFKIAKQSI